VKKKAKRGSSSSSESTVTTSSPSDSESDSDKRTKSSRSMKTRGKIEDKIHWELVNSMWLLAQRPAHLQDKKVVCRLHLDTINAYKEHYEKEEEKTGARSAIFGRDQRPKKVRVPGGTDDNFKKLVQARFDLTLPLSAPKKYWEKMPHKRAIYRHLPLAHLGLENSVSEKVVVAMHDRRNVIKLEMFHKANASKDKTDKQEWTTPTEVKHIQDAVACYSAIQRQLWPLDYSGLAITRALIDCKWGEIAGKDEKARCQLITRFFNEVAKENSGRAVRDEPPLTFDETKTRWTTAAEEAFPHLTILGLLARNTNQSQNPR